MTDASVESPCTRRCCLGEDDVCISCFRHIGEISAWSTSSPHDQRQILARCRERQQGRPQPPFVQEPTV